MTAPTTPAAALLAAAALIDGLQHPRIGLVDLHLALHHADPTGNLHQAALDLLAGHLAETGGDARWLCRWTARLPRWEAAAQLRAAAARMAVAA